MISSVVSFQLALAAVTSLVVAFAPPPQGRMLLVPLNGEPISKATVKDHHATPVKPEPLIGSWVVDGERETLAGLLSSNGIIVPAAPAAICGGPVPNREHA